MHATRDVDTSKVGAEKPAVGIKAPATFWEKVLFVLSRHRETSIAVIALILVIYFQVGSNGGVFLGSFFLAGLAGQAPVGVHSAGGGMFSFSRGQIDFVNRPVAVAALRMTFVASGCGCP